MTPEVQSRTQTTRQIFFTGPRQVDVQDVTVPPPAAGEVQIRTRKTLISTGTEGLALSGNFAPNTHWADWVKYPFQPGYSLAGEVVQVGEGVTSFKAGDRVGLRGPHKGFLNARTEDLIPIPEGITFEEATWFGISGIVQNGVRRARHELGETVVVIGLGMLGQLVVQYLRLLGAREVICIDFSEHRLDLAKISGATYTLRGSVEDNHQQVWDLTGGRGADVVYDVTGAASVLAPALRLLGRFGRLLLLGDTGKPQEQHLTAEMVPRALTIMGAHDTNVPYQYSEHVRWNHPEMAALFFQYLKRGDLRTAPLISRTFTPEQASEAYHLLLEDRSGVMGVVFDWD